MAWYETLASFDLETTGIDVRTARIVSACVVELRGDEVVARRDWLLDPGVPIPEQATRVHGITTERARAEGVAAPAGVQSILEAVRGVLARGLGLVVYNAPYDLTLLAHEARRHGLEGFLPQPIVDPIILDKQVDRYRKGKRTLDLTAAHYGVPLTDAHDAGADAIAAGRIAHAIGTRYAEALPQDAMELHRAQIDWAAQQQADFARFMRERVSPDWVSDRPAWPGGAPDWSGPAMVLAD
ncbi:MAG: DNA polymerase III subunit epsilon [Micrococcales bacterium 73-13]|nr:MAG: DNA polymerase III subunit epsilon [Micrococcales bacterium 73-13]